MSVMMVAFWAVLIWGIAWMVRQSTDRRGPTNVPGPPDATEILDRRFASGDIDETDYLSRKAVLTGHRADRGGP
jgi:uncharacterized membrane protein